MGIIDIDVSIVASRMEPISIQKLQYFIDKATALGADPTAELVLEITPAYNDPRPGESTPATVKMSARC